MCENEVIQLCLTICDPWSIAYHFLLLGIFQTRVPNDSAPLQAYVLSSEPPGKPFDCEGHNILWKILKEIKIPDHRTCFQGSMQPGQDAAVGIGQGIINWYKIGKEIHQGHISIYCHPAYLTFVQSNSWKVTCWKKFKLETKLLWKVWITLVIRWQHTNGWKTLGTKETSDEGERGDWKKLD